MRRNLKRLLSVLLTMTLCLSLLPGTALAVPENLTPITGITLDIEAPAAGAKPDYGVQAGPNDHFTVAYMNQWNQVPGPGDLEIIVWMDEDDTFADNGWYLAELLLIPEYGYQFTESSTVTVPGAAQTDIKAYDAGAEARVYAWFRVGGTSGTTSPINTIAITGVPIPAAGQTESEAAQDTGWKNITLSDGIGGYQHSYDVWDNTNDDKEDNAWGWLWDSDKFVAGKTYRILLSLYAADGYNFTGSISSATVNGKTAYIIGQGTGYVKVMLMFTPGEAEGQTSYPEHVPISYAEVISALWPVKGMTIPKDRENFTVSSECYTLTVAKWQRLIIDGAGPEWNDLTGTEEADTTFLQTSYRIYAEVKAEPWARFQGVIGSINGTTGVYETVSADNMTCTLTREVAVYQAVYAYPGGDTSGERDYTGVPFSITKPAAGNIASQALFGVKDRWERISGLYDCYVYWYEVPRVGSTYRLKTLTPGQDTFEADKVYCCKVRFLSERYADSSASATMTFRENFQVQGFFDQQTGAEIIPALMEQTVNDRHEKAYNFWFTTGNVSEQQVTDIAVTGPQLNSPSDLDGLVYGEYSFLTGEALAKFSCDKLTATDGYVYDDGDNRIVVLCLTVQSGYYLGLQQRITATYNGEGVPFYVDSWNPYDEGAIAITLFAGKLVSLQRDDQTEPVEYDSLEEAVYALGSDTGIITLQRSYTLGNDTVVIPNTARLSIKDGATLTVPSGKTLDLQNPAFLNSPGSIAVQAGGTLNIPVADGTTEAFVGPGDGARIRLTSGTLSFDIGEKLLTFGTGAAAEIPAGKEVQLWTSPDGETATPLNAVIASGGALTVRGALRGISGSGITNSGVLALNGGDETGGAPLGDVVKVTLKDSGRVYATADITAQLTNAEALVNEADRTYDGVTYPYAWAVKAPPSGGGGGGGVSTYAISLPAGVTNGTVTVSPKQASKGDTVTITVTPDEGYALDKLTVSWTSSPSPTRTARRSTSPTRAAASTPSPCPAPRSMWRRPSSRLRAPRSTPLPT